MTAAARRWCTIRVMDVEHQAEALSADPLRHWHAKAGHPVQHRAADLGLGLLGYGMSYAGIWVTP